MKTDIKHSIAIVSTAIVLLIGSALYAFENPSANSILGRASIKVVTINVWSGLDYRGIIRFGEYESQQRREKRFEILVRQLRSLNPDVVFIQEANPVGKFTSRLADSLGFDETHIVCNAGIKLVGIGIPANFEEGIAILARKSFHLKKCETWKLSGAFGLYGDFMAFHFDESEFAELARVTLHGLPVYLVNVHLSAFPPEDSLVQRISHDRLISGDDATELINRARKIMSDGSEKRVEEVAKLLEHIDQIPRGIPVILGGDFNAEMDSKEMLMLAKNGKFINSLSVSLSLTKFTWDPKTNENVSYSTRLVSIGGSALDFSDSISAIYDSKPRTIDHILLNSEFSSDDIRNARVVLDSTVGGIHTSDHYGVLAEIDMSRVLVAEKSTAMVESRSHIELLPIISYDTDTGFGYGAKLFLFDTFKAKESFDFVAFNSTKGERWYRCVFSYPDFEWRQGRVYPFAVDVTFDYDKWLKNNFYGVGNDSRYENAEKYTRLPIEFDVSLSRGFTPEIVGQFVMKYISVENYDFEEASRLRNLPPPLNASTARSVSAAACIRYDTRDSYVNPSEGVVLDGESECAPSTGLGNVSYLRLVGWFQFYHTLFYPKTVLAVRIGGQQIGGDNLPVQFLSSIGGNNTLRGYPQDRYLDRAAALTNAELRFPIYWRIGGVVGVDAGKVWRSLIDADLGKWAMNPVAGLRLYMDNFVVRADLGFGKEGTGFYFNFGQLF